MGCLAIPTSNRDARIYDFTALKLIRTPQVTVEPSIDYFSRQAYLLQPYMHNWIQSYCNFCMIDFLLT